MDHVLVFMKDTFKEHLIKFATLLEYLPRQSGGQPCTCLTLFYSAAVSFTCFFCVLRENFSRTHILYGESKIFITFVA
jgi:hypothetical protein